MIACWFCKQHPSHNMNVIFVHTSRICGSCDFTFFKFDHIEKVAFKLIKLQ